MTDAERQKGMQVQSIRFSDSQWALIRQIADLEGISASQLIRDAAFAYAIAVAIETGGLPTVERWKEALAAGRAGGHDLLKAAAAHALPDLPS